MKERSKPYVWVSTLAEVMAGDKSCLYSPWFKTRYQNYPKVERPFDADAWARNHTELVQRIISNYKELGVRTSIEDQNWMRVRGKVADLGAKPDVIAYDAGVVVIDAKTGQAKDSHRIQVKLYMWMWSMTKGLPTKGELSGVVVYTQGSDRPINWGEIDDDFIRQATDAIGLLASEPPAKSPSARACSWCEITSENCAERIGEDEAVETATTLF